MQRWQVRELGVPSAAMELVEASPPEPAPGEVTVEVRAAALNFFDVLLCRGLYQERPELPFTPGAEVAGVVAAAGEGSGFEAGQRVVALPDLPRGGFAGRVAVPAEGVFPIPDGMPFESAAALPISYGTAHFGLHRRAGLRAGETVLVHAGAGGVGSAAIQLARAAGARVIATAGGPEKAEVCRKLGAEVVVDYRAADFVEEVKGATGGRGADVVFDPVGGEVFDRSRRCVAFEGRIVVVGFASGRISDAPTNHALIKNYSIVGLHWGLYRKLMPGLVVSTHEELVRLYEAGSIDPLVYRVVPFEEVPRALELLAGRGTWGKVLTRPAEPG
jgi:NADPH2:quinone reductase